MLKNIYGLIIGFLLAASVAIGATYFDDLVSATLGVGSTPHSSNVLDVVSTTQSSRPCPAMSEAQRDAVSSPQAGNCIYNTDLQILNYYNGTTWGPISDPDSVLGPASSTQDAIARFDDLTGKLLADSSVTISDAGVMSGATQLNVENLRLDSSTISSTDTNGNINLEPNGTGEVVSTKTIVGGALESSGELIVAQEWQGAVQTNAAATGADASITNPVALAVNLTSAGLTSIGNIQIGVSTFAVITNSTGNIVTLKNDSTGTAAHRIITGTGADIEMEDDSSLLVYYEAGSVNRWRVIGGSGSGTTGPPPQQFTTKNTYNFESAVGNWALYNDGASATPVDCNSGTSSGDFLFSRETAAPLVGIGSGYINALNLANTQGEGVSALSDTIPAVYRGRPLELEFDYYGFGSYASGDFAVYAYDVTNGALLNGGSSLGSLNSGYNRFHSLVYPSTNTASIRLCIHNTTTATTLKNLHFDEVRLKLAESISVPLIGNWTTYAPTITTDSGSLPSRSSEVFRWRQDGPDILISTNITFSGTGSGSGFYIFTLPSGFTIKTSAVDNANNTSMGTFGAGGWYDQSSTPQGPILATGTGAANTIKFYGGGTSTNVPTNATIASGDRFNIIMRVPVNELSQNTVQGLANNSNLGRLRAVMGGAQSATTTPTILNLSSITENFNSGLSQAGGQFTATRPMRLLILAQTDWANLSAGKNLYLRKNGSNINLVEEDSTDTNQTISLHDFIQVATGDIIDLTVSTDSSTSVISTNAARTFIQFIEFPFSNISINTGPIYLGEQTWTDDQTNATTSVRMFDGGTFWEALVKMSFTGATTGGEVNLTIPSQYAASSFYNAGATRPVISLTATANDGSAPYGIAASLTSTTNIRVFSQGSGSLSNITTTNPFTWVSGDSIFLHLRWLKQ